MKYRQFGSIDWEVSALGINVQKLPVAISDPANDAVEASIRLIQRAIDGGVNLISIDCPHQQERRRVVLETVGRALENGYRDKTRIMTTLPVSYISEEIEIQNILDHELTLLNTNQIDFVTLGRINRDNMARLDGLNMFSILEGCAASGKINQVGLFFHDHYQILKQVLDMYGDWAFCQFQYSYMDVDHDPGLSGLKLAAERGLAVIATDPLLNGRLANVKQELITQLWDQAPRQKSLEAWGLDFAWNEPSVSTVMSEIEDTDQLDRFLAISDMAAPNNISIRDEITINRIRDVYGKLKEIPCPSCRPCMPCSEGIDVPRIFEIYNDSLMYDDPETARFVYENERHNGEDCIECGICSQRCAKELDIVSLLEKAVLHLSHP